MNGKPQPTQPLKPLTWFILIVTALTFLVGIVGIHALFGESTAGFGITILITLVGLLAVALSLIAWLVSYWGSGMSRTIPVRIFLAFLYTMCLWLVQYGALYQWIARRDPRAFTDPMGQANATYFTVGILTTGSSIYPQSHLARVAVSGQQLADLVLLSVGVAILITYIAEIREPRRSPHPDN